MRIFKRPIGVEREVADGAPLLGRRRAVAVVVFRAVAVLLSEPAVERPARARRRNGRCRIRIAEARRCRFVHALAVFERHRVFDGGMGGGEQCRGVCGVERYAAVAVERAVAAVRALCAARSAISAVFVFSATRRLGVIWLGARRGNSVVPSALATGAIRFICCPRATAALPV